TTEGAKQRTVYLPAGNSWIDFWTGTRAAGGRTIMAEAPLERIPIYARAGSIIPFGQRVDSSAGNPDPIDLRIYAGANGDFAFYEDEDDNYNYERGAHTVIPLHWDDKTETLTLGDRRGTFPGMREHRTFHAVLVRDGRYHRIRWQDYIGTGLTSLVKVSANPRANKGQLRYRDDH